MALTERDLIELNSYLDGALDAAASRIIEQRLNAEPELRAEYDSMRVTKALLRQAPRLRAPRNFTLDPARYGRPVRQGWFGGFFTMRTLAGAASLVTSLLLLAGALFTRLPIGASAPAMAEPQNITMAEFAAEEAAAEMPAEEPAAEPSMDMMAAEAPAEEAAAGAAAQAPAPASTTGPDSRALTPTPSALPTQAATTKETPSATPEAEAAIRTMPPEEAAVAEAGEIAAEDADSVPELQSEPQAIQIARNLEGPSPWLVGLAVFFAVAGAGLLLVKPSSSEL